MPHEWKVQNVNDEKARAFQQIVTAGWGNLSDGDVNESPIGHVSLIHIEPSERSELVDAVFEGEPIPNGVYPGSYVLVEDSDGNATLTEHLTLDIALNYYNHLQALNGGEAVSRENMPLDKEFKVESGMSEMMVSYRDHLPPHVRNEECESKGCIPLRPEVVSTYEDEDEKLYLVHLCGEAFDDMKIALEHSTKCDDLGIGHTDTVEANEFRILPESEAL